MKLEKTRQKQVFLYKQKKEFERFKDKGNFVSDFDITNGSRKRVLGKTAKALGSTLAKNLDKSSFDELCLRVNTSKFDALVRIDGAVARGDVISPLNHTEIQRILVELGYGGIDNVWVDRT